MDQLCKIYSCYSEDLKYLALDFFLFSCMKLSRAENSYGNLETISFLLSKRFELYFILVEKFLLC